MPQMPDGLHLSKETQEVLREMYNGAKLALPRTARGEREPWVLFIEMPTGMERWRWFQQKF